MQRWSRVAGGQRRVSGGLPLTTVSTAAHSAPLGRRRGAGLSVEPTTSRAINFASFALQCSVWIEKRPTGLVLFFEVGRPPHDGEGRAVQSSGALAAGGRQDRRTLRTHPTRRPREDIFLPKQNRFELLIAGVLRRGATAAALFLQRNSVPSTHMRCRTTARRLATATMARRMPRRWATRKPHAFSHDHFPGMTNSDCAAS